MRFSLVITSLTFFFLFVSNRRSLLVRIPTSLSFVSTIGIPPILFSFISFNASEITASTFSVIGSMMRPLSLRLTRRTSSTWLSMLMFLCKIPMPPSLASAMAKLASVTVSIAEESNGMFNVMSFVSLVARFTSRGKISEYAGTSNTSSKVRPSPTNLVDKG